MGELRFTQIAAILMAAHLAFLKAIGRVPNATILEAVFYVVVALYILWRTYAAPPQEGSAE